MSLIRRVAFLSLHTSPMEQPGSGDAGGMNVYIRALAAALAETGVEVEIFTRSTSAAQAAVEHPSPGSACTTSSPDRPGSCPRKNCPNCCTAWWPKSTGSGSSSRMAGTT